MSESVSQKLAGTLVTQSNTNFACNPLSEIHIVKIHAIESAVHQSPWSAQSFSDCLTGRQLCYVVTVPESGNDEGNIEIVAYIVIALAGPDAEILNIAVADNWQKKGIGRALLQRAVNAIKGISEIIYLEVRESNVQAIELYASEDFVEVGVRENYYPAKKGREDAIIFALTLSETF